MCQCNPNNRCIMCPTCPGYAEWQQKIKEQAEHRDQVLASKQAEVYNEEVRDEALKAHYEKEYPQVTLTSDMLKLILYDAHLPKEKVEEIMTKVAKCQR